MRRLLLLLGLIMTALPLHPVAAQACETGTALRSGLTVRVRTGVNVRAAPSLNGRDIGGLAAGRTVTLLDGPVCGSAINWWRINDGQQMGWVAEATTGVRFLEPAAVTEGALTGPLGDLRVEWAAEPTLTRPADQCPPISGDISVNFAGVADPLASGAEAAFFTDGGFGAPMPALCVPRTRAADAALILPDGTAALPVIVPVSESSDFVRVTLPEAALLQTGTWRVALGDFWVDVHMTGPLAPMADARVVDGATEVLLVGFAPLEDVAIFSAEVVDGVAGEPRVMILTVDRQGMGGATLADLTTPVLATVSESGLIALPSAVQALAVEGAETRIAGYDALVTALWGPEALGLPEAAESPDDTAAQGCTYTVRRGDTLFLIALAHGFTSTQMREANPQLTNPQLIHVGDVLNLPECD